MKQSFIRRLRRLFLSEKWNVGIINEPIHRFLEPDYKPKIHWLPERKGGSFVADPFGTACNDKLTILLEQYDDEAKKGKISSLCLDMKNPSKEYTNETVIQRPMHISYPFLLEYKGEMYCIPETARDRKVYLYKAVSFPAKWEVVAEILDGFSAVDPTVIEYNDLWWMFCTDRESRPLSDLYVWYSKSLSGPWKPHSKNPVKRDVCSSRPAGTPFIQDGVLYRPAQNSSKTYGGSVVINRVEELSLKNFSEEPVAMVDRAKTKPYCDGAHTISSAGDYTLIDGKKEVFIIKHFMSKLAAKTIRLWQKKQKCW